VALQMHQLHGLGNAATVIASVVGPAAQAGADIFRTTQEKKIAEKELKQRRAESATYAELSREALEASERQQVLAQALALRQAQARRAQTQTYMPYYLGLGALALLAVAAAAAARK